MSAYRPLPANHVFLGILATCSIAFSWSVVPASTRDTIENPNIDMAGYLAAAHEAAAWRETHRLSEAEFLQMSKIPNTLVLDARSAEKFNELHIRNAFNLSFPDITVESLARAVPNKDTRVLIYCNNNFRNAEGPFPTKLNNASLNLSTFIALYSYGYRNVFELGPSIDFGATMLDFDSSSAANPQHSR
jgi:hypothetical protein